MSTNRTIKKTYIDKSLPGSFSGLPTFIKANKYTDVKKVREVLSGVDAYTLYRPTKLKIKTRPTLTFFPHMSYACDLMQMSKKVVEREKFGFCLLALDMYSRYCYHHICKQKTGVEVLAGLKAIFKESGKFCHFLLVDRGLEFYNKPVEDYLKKNGVHIYSVSTPRKASQVERVIGTIRRGIARALEVEPRATMKALIPKIIKNYNHRYHTAVKMSPADALKPENKAQVFVNIYKKLIESKPITPKFKVGMYVRLSKNRVTFQKQSSIQSYSTQIFRIRKAVKASPPFYYLSDLKGEEVIGSFLNENLIQVAAPETTSAS